jgi:hypothetical protein
MILRYGSSDKLGPTRLTYYISHVGVEEAQNLVPKCFYHECRKAAKASNGAISNKVDWFYIHKLAGANDRIF